MKTNVTLSLSNETVTLMRETAKTLKLSYSAFAEQAIKAMVGPDALARLALASKDAEMSFTPVQLSRTDRMVLLSLQRFGPDQGVTLADIKHDSGVSLSMIRKSLPVLRSNLLATTRGPGPEYGSYKSELWSVCSQPAFHAAAPPEQPEPLEYDPFSP